MSNRPFWNTVKPSMTNKGILADDKTVIESEKIKSKGKDYLLDIKVGNVINDEEVLVEMFNYHYVNIVENYTGVAPVELGTTLDPKLDRDKDEKILKHYKNHSSITEIKKLTETNESFAFF